MTPHTPIQEGAVMHLVVSSLPSKPTKKKSVNQQKKKKTCTVARLFSNKEDGHTLHSGEVQHPGAPSDAPEDGGERERLRAAVLRDGAVLPEPRVLGDGAADPAGRHGAERRGQHAGCAGAEGEEREEGDQSAQHAALHQGERVEVSVREGGGQTGAGQRRRQDVLHHREGAAHQRLHLRAQREQQLELRRLHRRHRGGRAHTQRIPRQGHGSLAQGHHAHDQVQRLGHHQGQGSGRQIEDWAGSRGCCGNL